MYTLHCQHHVNMSTPCKLYTVNTMYTLHCQQMYTLQCQHNVHFTLSTPCTLYTVNNVHFTLSTHVHFTLSAPCTLYTINTLHTLHCQSDVHYTLACSQTTDSTVLWRVNTIILSTRLMYTSHREHDVHFTLSLFPQRTAHFVRLPHTSSDLSRPLHLQQHVRFTLSARCTLYTANTRYTKHCQHHVQFTLSLPC